jgi:hypothetical protein
VSLARLGPACNIGVESLDRHRRLVVGLLDDEREVAPCQPKPDLGLQGFGASFLVVL